jgi:RHS repeat-associated protein
VTRHLYLQGVDQIFARIDAGTGHGYFYYTDAQGSVSDIVDESTGLIVDKIDYDPYGNIWNETAPTYGDRYKYTAREWDATIGLQYNRARWYDPQTRTFISQDPAMADSLGNAYRYVENDPMDGTDPSGLDGAGFWDTASYVIWNPWQTTKMVVGSVVGDAVNGGKALVTGEAGAALGDRAVAIVENSGGVRYTGTVGQNFAIAKELGLQLTGITQMAEGVAGADAASGQQLPTDQRLQRGAFGLSAYAGTAAGTAGLVKVAAPTTSVVVTSRGLSTLQTAVPTFSSLPGSAAVAGITTPLSTAVGNTVRQVTPQIVQDAASFTTRLLETDLGKLALDIWRKIRKSGSSPKGANAISGVNPLEAWENEGGALSNGPQVPKTSAAKLNDSNIAPKANPWEGLPLRSNARGTGEAAAGSYVKNRIPLTKDVPDGVYKFVIDKDGKAWIAPTSEIELPHSALVPRGEQVRAAGYAAVKNGKANVNGHSGHYMADQPVLGAEVGPYDAAVRATFQGHGVEVINHSPGVTGGLLRPPP